MKEKQKKVPRVVLSCGASGGIVPSSCCRGCHGRHRRVRSGVPVVVVVVVKMKALVVGKYVTL